MPLSAFFKPQTWNSRIFPGPGQDIEVVEDYVGRVGGNEANRTLSKLWERPIHKRHDAAFTALSTTTGKKIRNTCLNPSGKLIALRDK
jgi:hypothetical protein